jgi:hypothetical protein
MTAATTSSVPTRNFVWSERKRPATKGGPADGELAGAGPADAGASGGSLFTLSPWQGGPAGPK